MATQARLERDLLVVAVHRRLRVHGERSRTLAVRAALRLYLGGGVAGLREGPEHLAAGAARVGDLGELREDTRATRHDAANLDERVEVRVPARGPPRDKQRDVSRDLEVAGKVFAATPWLLFPRRL